VSDFARQQDGFKFVFAGMKTNASPDSMPPDKYALIVNARSYRDNSIRTRPGYVQVFAAGVTFTDIRTYAALATDDLPRVLARDITDAIWLDTGVQVGTLAGAGASPTAAMIPFRPNASPNPWMYVANGYDYQKFSSPGVASGVTQQKVGIAEPQFAPSAALNASMQVRIAPTVVNYTPAGSAGSLANGTRVTDTAGAVFLDSTPGAINYNVQVTSGAQYQRFMELNIAGVGYVVTDVFPALTQTFSLSGIYYFSGATGRCIVVPNNLGGDMESGEESIKAPQFLVALRRGALIQIDTEICMVLSVTLGPNGTIAIETSTTGTHAVGSTFTSVAAIQVLNSTGSVPAAGNAITDADVSATVGAGTGTITAALVASPFSLSGVSFQADDYISIGINVDNLANLTEMKFLWDVGDGSFTENFYYYAVRPSDIAAAVANNATQLATAQTVRQRSIADEEDAIESGGQGVTRSGQMTVPGSGQWSQILIPIRSLTRVGGDLTKSLQTANAFQFFWNASGTIHIIQGNILIFGGSQPDVGDVGAPLLYRVRPRSSVTGAKGNPSPETRFGVNPRRQQVVVSLPSAAYDAQIDTWDIFRYGGSVTSWRWVGQVPASTSQFLDNFDDAAAEGGDELEMDNFEPWPSIDLPMTDIAATVCGTIAVVTTTNPNITSYLPGTLVQIGGQNVYTLYQRPIAVLPNVYLLQFVENAGTAATVPFIIQEPIIANQHLPYMWGPDADGIVFACGDSLRPGNVYFSKSYAPDSAPDAYNLEITQPSEPLLGGVVVDGLALVGSSARWWALIPQPDNPLQRYNVRQQPFVRGIASPQGICTDGKTVWWYAKDGIQSSDKGSITDADLYNIFPHEGVAGETITRNGVTISPPDYTQAKKFRLTHSNGFLYATYCVLGGGYAPTLVYDVKRGAWMLDQYNVLMSTFYSVEQQPSSGTVLNPVLLMAGAGASGGATGAVYRQQDLTNDAGAPIAGILSTFEYDGGDVRAPKQWGDLFLDAIPAAVLGLQVSLESVGSVIAGPLPIAVSTTRVRQPLDLGGVVVADFAGLLATWADDFNRQTVATRFYAWQPSYIVQPARGIGWYTFGTSFKLNGYLHVRQILLAWVSTLPITLTITSYDGQSPQPITIPSSGGQYQKALFPLTANKGMLYKFQARSLAPFQIFMDDSEIYAGAWGRPDAYSIERSFGSANVAQGVA
jgi:hypothetical protein